MKYDDVTQLPPKYQEQARRKLAEKNGIVPKTGQKEPATGKRALVRAVRREQEQIVSGTSREDAVRKKYRNQAATVDGIRFDSQKEARRFQELREMEKCGAIWDLRLQVNFTLREGYTTAEGLRVRPIVYRADFAYQMTSGAGHTIYIVEDVKSKATKTRVYELKKKLLRDKYGLEISEI